MMMITGKRLGWTLAGIGLMLMIGSAILTYAFRVEAAGNTYYVDAGSGSDSNLCEGIAEPCLTVAGAVSKASAGDTIIVAAGTYPVSINLSGKGLTFIGAGADQTFFDGEGTGRVLRAYETDLIVKGVTIQNGVATSSGGAGIFTSGSLILEAVILTNNQSTGTYPYGGAVNASGVITMTDVIATGNTGERGGGFYLTNFGSRGTIQIDRVAVVNNTTTDSSFGAFTALGADITVQNSTISNNVGEGLKLANSSVLTLTHATIAENTGLGIDQFGDVYVRNSIVSGNNGSGDECVLRSAWVDSFGGNVEETNSCGFDHGDDLVNTDPLLAPLVDNGGATLTHALLSGSPAIDAGQAAGCLSEDQRQVSRPAACDSGAFEKVDISITSVNLNGPSTGFVNSGIDFTADVLPNTASQPITYTFSMAGQSDVVQVGTNQNTATLSWPTTGLKTVTVTADNGLSQQSANVQIDIQEGTIGIDSVVITGPVAGEAGEDLTFTATISPPDATLPVTYNWTIDGQSSINHVGGNSHEITLNWPSTGSYTLSVTASNSESGASDSHVIVLSAWYVDPAGSNLANCLTPQTACQTIQHVLGQAPSGATIQLATGTYDEAVTIEKPVTILGPAVGAAILTNSSGDAVTLDDGSFSGLDIVLQGVTVRGAAGVGIQNSENLTLRQSIVDGNNGRGINNSGTIVIEDAILRGNNSASGAAFFSSGTATLTNVTVTENMSDNSILHTQSGGVTDLVNVTVSGNTGPAIISASGGTVNILNSTIVNNPSGGISNFSAVTLQNTVLADNGGNNCYTFVTSLGHNLEDEDDCGLDQTGDVINADPNLRALSPNGGFGKTHSPGPGSPIIDAGNNSACPTTDARGLNRPIDGDGVAGAVCDIGAVETDQALLDTGARLYMPLLLR